MRVGVDVGMDEGVGESGCGRRLRCADVAAGPGVQDPGRFSLISGGAVSRSQSAAMAVGSWQVTDGRLRMADGVWRMAYGGWRETAGVPLCWAEEKHTLPTQETRVPGGDGRPDVEIVPDKGDEASGAGCTATIS